MIVYQYKYSTTFKSVISCDGELGMCLALLTSGKKNLSRQIWCRFKCEMSMIVYEDSPSSCPPILQQHHPEYFRCMQPKNTSLGGNDLRLTGERPRTRQAESTMWLICVPVCPGGEPTQRTWLCIASGPPPPPSTSRDPLILPGELCVSGCA